MREQDVGTERDPPRPWVIEVVTTFDGVRKFGSVLGRQGFTGRFVDGDIAGLARDGAKWRRMMRGGDDRDGDEAVHEARP